MERGDDPANNGATHAARSRVLIIGVGSNPARIGIPPGCTVVGCVGTAEAAASTIPALKPDLVLVDSAMYGSPGFAEVLNLMKAAFPWVRVETAEGRRDPGGCAGAVTGNGGRQSGQGVTSCEAPTKGFVTVWSPKGGVGRTFLTCNLAACVCAKETREVALLDLDLKWGDAAIHIGLNEGATILDALPYLDDAAAGSLKRYMSRDKRTGVMALLAPGKPELSELVSGNQIRRAISLAQKEFEFVFVDTSPDMHPDILGGLMEESSAVVIVTTHDVACLRRVRISLELMNKSWAGVHRRTLVVVNQALDNAPITISHIESFLNLKVSGVLPADRLAAESSVYEGVPLVVADPGHRLSRAIVAIAAHLCPGVDVERVKSGRLSLPGIRAMIQRRVTSGKSAGAGG